jgi:hypothetical protein
MQKTTHTCKNCGNTFTGKFCNNCGEKVYDEHDKRISHLFEEAFHFITHLEGSFFKTVKTILTRPGRFAKDYCAGIRKKYFKPISLFLILIVLYLLFPFLDGLNLRFHTYVSPEYQYSAIAAPVAKQKMKTHHLTEEQLTSTYDKKSPAFAKLFILILIPLTAVLLWLLFITSKRYFFDHFILAIEIISFLILVIYLLMPLMIYITVSISPRAESFFQEGTVFSYVIYVLFGVYVSRAFRNFYKQKRWVSAVKALVFWLVFLIGIQFIYRILLYFLVMLFI